MRDRMEKMKSDMNSQMSGVINKMMSVMGQDPHDLMSENQINQVLAATFKKFDKDRSGQLEYPEFVSASVDLRLSGTERELKEAFGKVDVDKSGYVDMQEFMFAIKDGRSTELLARSMDN